MSTFRIRITRCDGVRSLIPSKFHSRIEAEARVETIAAELYPEIVEVRMPVGIIPKKIVRIPISP